MTWLLTALSLIGVVLNIQHRRECFALWLVTNVSWCVVDASVGLWSQATLQLVYAGLSVWGWLKWKEKKSDAKD